MAGPGKQRKLGPGPGSGVCSSRVRPGSCVGVTGRPAPACTLPARGKHKASLREPAAPAAHLPPRGLRAGGGRGRWEHGGGREAGRRGGGRRARAGGGGGGGERGWAGGATSRLLWLARYIRSRPPAALPTLPAPRLACTPPAVLRHPAIQRDALRTDGADMGRAIVARLGLGLLLLALLLPTQTYSNQTTVATPSNSSSQTTSPALHPANATTKASDGTLQSTASLFVISVSLLHLYC
ncbi:signal transducer CD24 [Muntiacus reevesi]